MDRLSGAKIMNKSRLILGRNTGKLDTTPIKSKEELKQRLIEEWKNIPLNELKKITGNTPKRLRYVIKSKGYPTKY